MAIGLLPAVAAGDSTIHTLQVAARLAGTAATPCVFACVSRLYPTPPPLVFVMLIVLDNANL